jgi:class 3 adenylate cyclase
MPFSRSVQKLLDSLDDAQGLSEFVIVVVCDVRGFSDFSTQHESPDIAMYIKRLYLQLLTKYFPSAKFAKPTGDGLLLIFPYSEDTLKAVAKQVITACFKCLKDFPTICQADPMINFQAPQRMGFGISRGPACCLFSGKEILDYSGHLLNLASRLKDLARPSGILIDGHFLKPVIPSNLVKHFEKADIYIRSLAEEEPTEVFFSKEHVQLTESSKLPIKSPNWKTLTARITRKALFDNAW